MSDADEWQSPVPDAAEAIGSTGVTIGLGTRHGPLGSEDLAFDGVDLFTTRDGQVCASVVTEDEDSTFAFYMMPEQAEAWAQGLEKAAEWAYHGVRGDVITAHGGQSDDA